MEYEGAKLQPVVSAKEGEMSTNLQWIDLFGTKKSTHCKFVDSFVGKFVDSFDMRMLLYVWTNVGKSFSHKFFVHLMNNLHRNPLEYSLECITS